MVMHSLDSSSRVRPMVLVRGTLDDRPWGATLAAIGLSGHTGQLTLRAKGDGKVVHQLAFAHGVLVGATSPHAVDTLQRIALSSGLVAPASIAAATRIIGRSDDVDRFADAIGLGPAQVQQFKKRLLVQRAARTFAVERGDYTVEERVTIPVLLGVEADVRAAIYLGMRLNLSHERLASDLRQLGTRFVLRAEAAADLARFDLGDDEQPIIEALRTGTSLPELEASDRTLDPRMIAALLGALASCNTVASIDPRTITPQDISLARSPTPREPTISRVPTPREPTSSSCVPMIIAHDPPVTRPSASAPTHPANVQFRRAEALPRVPSGRSLTDPFLEGQATTMRPAELSQMQIRELIMSRLELLEEGADHFTFLGVPFGATVSDVREAYLELARYLRPEKLKELGIPDDRDEARSVFAQAVIAFTTLTDAVRRAEYLVSARRRQSR